MNSFSILSSVSRLSRPLVAVALGLVVALSAPHSSGHAQLLDPNAMSSARLIQDAFTNVAERVSPSVVSIQVEIRRAAPQMPFGFPFFFGTPGNGDGDGIQRGGGSGVILRPDGYILTNHHVVDSASNIEVRLQNGRTYEAKLIGTDEATDLAVIKIEANGLPAAQFASADNAKVGQWVIAIGSPFGLDYTVTTGVLSAKGRGGFAAGKIEDYLQTDASINPGNSGGPLVDLNGAVLGINTMILGRGTGIGFAIPSEMSQRVADQLINQGKVTRAWLGVTFAPVTPELAAHFGQSTPAGALVNEVSKGGPAARAGVEPGDVILKVGSANIVRAHDLLRAVLRHNVGEKVSLTVLRAGETKLLNVTFTDRTTAMNRIEQGAPVPDGNAPHESMLGLGVDTLSPEDKRRLGFDTEGTVVVTAVEPSSIAARAGLQRGDVLLSVDRQPLRSVDTLRASLRDGSALLYVERGQANARHRFFVVLSGKR